MTFEEPLFQPSTQIDSASGRHTERGLCPARHDEDAPARQDRRNPPLMKPFPVPQRGPAAAARNIRHKDPVRPPGHPCADLQAFTSKFHKLLGATSGFSPTKFLHRLRDAKTLNSFC